VKKPVTHVSILLDGSGSMLGKLHDTIEGINSYLDGLADEKGVDFRTTMAVFDSTRFDIISNNDSMKNTPKLNTENYRCSGMTPLFDSISRIVGMADNVKADRKVVVIMTDGYENDSREIDRKGVSDIVKSREGNDWSFVFLGASFDNYGEAGSLGIGRVQTMSYNANDRGSTQAAYRGLVETSAAYASGATQSMEFSDVVKASAGDEFYEKIARIADDKEEED